MSGAKLRETGGILMRWTSLAAAAALAACQPASEQKQTPPAPQPQVAACNDVAPDAARQVAVQDPVATAAMADLRGGPISPGTYDLTSATRVGGATGWSGTRAVALEASESDNGVVINWAATDAEGERDTLSASLSDSPNIRLTYSCGRIGEVEAAFTAGARALTLRLADGANGALLLVFQKRA
jgi:hypothetical protein